MSVCETTKTLDGYFIDWESSAFGFGYGTGEEFILPLLRKFLELCNTGSTGVCYDHKELEAQLSAAPAWFLINVLCREDIVEYGSSPRYGWLTKAGEALRAYALSKTADELYEIAAGHDDHIPCSRESCNCGEHGYEKGRVCKNPFWGR